jgi:hypothetical protein
MEGVGTGGCVRVAVPVAVVIVEVTKESCAEAAREPKNRARVVAAVRALIIPQPNRSGPLGS